MQYMAADFDTSACVFICNRMNTYITHHFADMTNKMEPPLPMRYNRDYRSRSDCLPTGPGACGGGPDATTTAP